MSTARNPDSERVPVWIRALLQEASQCPPDRRGLAFGTPWGGSLTGREPEPDADKHRAYVAYIREATERACPGLLAVLARAGANIYVCPGTFAFCLTGEELQGPFIIPELVPLTRRTPFVPKGHTIH